MGPPLFCLCKETMPASNVHGPDQAEAKRSFAENFFAYFLFQESRLPAQVGFFDLGALDELLAGAVVTTRPVSST